MKKVLPVVSLATLLIPSEGFAKDWKHMATGRVSNVGAMSAMSKGEGVGMMMDMRMPEGVGPGKGG